MGQASQTSVVFDAVELVFRPMCLALDSLGQPYYNTFNKAVKALPYASLLLRGVLMFKASVVFPPSSILLKDILAFCQCQDPRRALFQERKHPTVIHAHGYEDLAGYNHASLNTAALCCDQML
jgi:hypothetical protein